MFVDAFSFRRFLGTYMTGRVGQVRPSACSGRDGEWVFRYGGHDHGSLERAGERGQCRFRRGQAGRRRQRGLEVAGERCYVR